jgi:hypothetical protein
MILLRMYRLYLQGFKTLNSMFTGSGLFGFFHTGFIVHYRHITINLQSKDTRAFS